VRQVLFRIPPWSATGVPIYGFGMMLFLAFILCTWLAGRRAQREGVRKEVIQDLAIWLFIGGILGARVTYVLYHDHPASVGQFFWLLPQIWNGGIILYGAVLGGLAGYLLAYYLVLRGQAVSTWMIADIVAPSVALGLALGRVGCFLNGCCFGGVACPECPTLLGSASPPGLLTLNGDAHGLPVAEAHFPLSSPPWMEVVSKGQQTAAGFTIREQEPPLPVVGVVDPDSAARAAGLRAGDLIVRADGQEIDNYNDLWKAVGAPSGAGHTELRLVVGRGGEEVELQPFRPRTIGVHPTQLYETVSMVLLLLLLLAYEPFRRNAGELAGLLMVGYGAHRFVNELLRADERPVGFERYGSILLVAAGVVLWIWRRRLATAERPIAKAA
jgi:phosphatidylglycerol:prolipoprotein diacylglycerol transferase